MIIILEAFLALILGVLCESRVKACHRDGEGPEGQGSKDWRQGGLACPSCDALIRVGLRDPSALCPLRLLISSA